MGLIQSVEGLIGQRKGNLLSAWLLSWDISLLLPSTESYTIGPLVFRTVPGFPEFPACRQQIMALSLHNYTDKFLIINHFFLIIKSLYVLLVPFSGESWLINYLSSLSSSLIPFNSPSLHLPLSLSLLTYSFSTWFCFLFLLEYKLHGGLSALCLSYNQCWISICGISKWTL